MFLGCIHRFQFRARSGPPWRSQTNAASVIRKPGSSLRWPPGSGGPDTPYHVYVHKLGSLPHIFTSSMSS